MEFDLLDIISIITAFQLLLLATFLLSHGSRRQLNHRILAAFMIANAVFIGDFLQIHLRLYLEFPHLLLSGFSFIFLFGPLLFFYTQSLTRRNFSFKPGDLIHALPFLAYWIYLIFNFYIHDSERKIALITSGGINTLWGKLHVFDLGHLSIMIYMAASLWMLRQFRQGLKDIFSSIENLNLSWLRLVLYGFLLMWLCDLTNTFVFRFITPPQWLPDLLLHLSLIINFVFANIAVYRGLKQPEIFSGAPLRTRAQPKYQNSTLTPADSRRYLKELAGFMESRKPYLNPSLTLPELAEHAGIPPRHLSQLINESLQQNFFDFINSYRIEEACRLLSHPIDDKITVLEVLYEVGFNSKSAFNTAFKKHTGITPSEFKKSHLKVRRAHAIS